MFYDHLFSVIFHPFGRGAERPDEEPHTLEPILREMTDADTAWEFESNVSHGYVGLTPIGFGSTRLDDTSRTAERPGSVFEGPGVLAKTMLAQADPGTSARQFDSGSAQALATLSATAVTFDAYSTSFDSFDPAEWQLSDYANPAGWIKTAWDPAHVLIDDGSVTLLLEQERASGKPYTGAEIRSEERYFYGQYEVTMQVSDADGTLSSFFLYSGPAHDTVVSEIDLEFLGNDTTKVLATFHTSEGSDGVLIDLGFDAAAGFHTYTIDWRPIPSHGMPTGSNCATSRMPISGSRPRPVTCT